MARAPKKAAAPAETKTLRQLGLQKTLRVEIHRSKLVNAPYNPRIITDGEKRRLRAGLKKHGLVSSITWNQKSGHIVGGHQRLAVLDALAGTADYKLEVDAGEWDELTEKELNLLLNNPEAQGAWDLDKLGDILKTPKLDLSGAGFEQADVYRLFGEAISLPTDTVAIGDLAGDLEKLQESFARMEKGNVDDGHDFYMVVVFNTPTERREFMERAGLDDNRYQSGKSIAALCGLLDDDKSNATAQESGGDGAKRRGVGRQNGRRKAAASGV